MRNGAIWCAVFVLLGPALDAADGIEVTDRGWDASHSMRRHDLRLVRDTGVAVGGPGSPLERAAREALAYLAARRGGDGGGATVDNLFVMQINFKESNCPFIPEGEDQPLNVVFLAWDTPTPNALDVDVIMDDNVLATVEDAKAYGLRLGGTLEILAEPANPTQIFLIDVPAGVHVFRVEDGAGGTASEVELEVLDAQPFADVEDLVAEPGPGGADGSCSFGLSWKNVCPVPDDYVMFVDGTTSDGSPFAGVVDPPIESFRSFLWLGVPDGSYVVSLRGFLEYQGNPNALYRGCFVDSDADPSTEDPDPSEPGCDASPCSTALPGLQVIQLVHGGATGPHSFRLRWILGESYSEGLNLYFNGAVVGQFPAAEGLFNWLEVELAGPPGQVTFGIQGDCGADGQTPIRQLSFGVLGESPHPNPVDGVILCEWNQDTGSTETSWKNADCSSYADRYLNAYDPESPLSNLVGNLGANDPNDIFILGNATEDTVIDTAPADLVEYQFFTWVGDDQHGSPFIRCTDEPPPIEEFFIRGVCNAGIPSKNPQITDGIFILNRLFQGGPPPGCFEACDVNGDGLMNLSDGPYIFQFLFLAGPPPVGWGGQTPVCTPIEEGMDCEIPNTACPL